MLIQLLTSLLPTLTPKNTKVHLAQHNGLEHPMDVYLEGGFDKWQSWQTRKNFECQYVIGLVELPGTKRWLLVCCSRNNLLYLHDLKRLTSPLDFAQNLLSLCVPNVPGRLSIS